MHSKFFKGAMIYAMVIGGAVALFCLFGAGLIIPTNQKDAILALQILAPTIFLSGILGVFRGYFQAYRNMMPTSISQILEQVFNAAVSLLAAWGFINVFADGSENSIAKWGAAGSTVGTGAGVVAATYFYASCLWREPWKDYASCKQRPQTSGRILQRDFPGDRTCGFSDHSQCVCL